MVTKWMIILVCAVIHLLYINASTLRISKAISSSMVLQRSPEHAIIWGWDSPLTNITVTFDGIEYNTTAELGKGKWSVQLAPKLAGSYGDILISSSSGNLITLSDVLFGDVFLCSGQSNMVFSLGQNYDNKSYIEAADDPIYQDIRLFTVKPTYSSTPEDDVVVEQSWTPASSKSVGHPNAFSYFSAICWFTGKSIFDDNDGHVPIGLLVSAFGGTRVHQWSTSLALSHCNQTARPTIPKPSIIPWNHWSVRRQRKTFTNITSDNSNMWNAMASPLLLMRFAGVFWMQGESDVDKYDGKHEAQRGAAYYRCAINAMITDWRNQFNQTADWPFMWVQLSPWVGHEAATSHWELPALRAAQMAAQELPGCGFASAVDLGDFDPSTNRWDAVHFRNKAPLGPRLAAVAKSLVYRQNHTLWEGPQAVSAQLMSVDNKSINNLQNSLRHSIVRDTTSVNVRVSFSPKTIGSGLILHLNLCPFFRLNNTKNIGKCGWWEILSQSKEGNVTASNATVTIIKNQVFLTTKIANGNQAFSVRYLWADWPVPSLYNKEGFPAPPFILDITS